MTEIILIRHGETAWNVEQRVQGHQDIPLNATGQRQAKTLAHALSNEPLDAIVTSDLQRAIQTAQALAIPRGMEIQRDPGLRERSFGAFEGLRHTEISRQYPEAYQAWKARDLDARYPQGLNGAETLREFSTRVMDSMIHIAKKERYRKIAIVTHGGVLDCVYRIAQQINFFKARDFDILNASINRLLWDGNRFQVSQWSDTTHLARTVLDEIK